MELSGALSNPRAQVEIGLRPLTGLAAELRLRHVPEREPRHLPPRACRIQDLVQRYVDSVPQPVRVRDVCDGLEALGVAPFDKAAVRKTLHDGARAPVPRYARLGWGLYASVRQAVE